MIQSILYRILSLIKLPPWTPYESNDSTKGAQRKNVQYLKKQIENIFIIQIICPKFSSNRKNLFFRYLFG